MRMETVNDFIERLKQFPPHWRVVVSTTAGGVISIEHREMGGKPIVAVFGSNGGRFGENPLTEDEYERKSAEFLRDIKDPSRSYTSDHGDHRMYSPQLGPQASCYGTHYDRRVIERMVDEGLLRRDDVDLERVKRLDT